VLNCLQQPLMEVVVPRLLKHLRYGTVDVQVGFVALQPTTPALCRYWYSVVRGVRLLSPDQLL